jgi:hypothetical protein
MNRPKTHLWLRAYLSAVLDTDNTSCQLGFMRPYPQSNRGL